MSLVSPAEMHAEASLPAFVEKAREEAQWFAALERAGYRSIKAAYTAQLRNDPETEVFRGLQGVAAPPVEVVRDWLKAKEKRNLQQLRWTFVGTMLATIATGLAFAAVYSLLG
jgi:hypothetical protein